MYAVVIGKDCFITKQLCLALTVASLHDVAFVPLIVYTQCYKETDMRTDINESMSMLIRAYDFKLSYDAPHKVKCAKKQQTTKFTFANILSYTLTKINVPPGEH